MVMKKSKAMLFVGLIVAVIGATALWAKPPAPTMKKIAEFDLPGPGGKRFDYLTLTPDDHYLLSTHLAAGQTYVIGVKTNKVWATIGDTPAAEVGDYSPQLRKRYTATA